MKQSPELIVIFLDGPNAGRCMRNVLGKYVVQCIRTPFGKKIYDNMVYTYVEKWNDKDGTNVMSAKLTPQCLKRWKYYQRGKPNKRDAKYPNYIPIT